MPIQLTMDAQPVEADGKFWVDITVGRQALKRRGPFTSETAARTAANNLMQEFQPNTPTVPAAKSDDIIVLNGKPTSLDSDLGRKFITDSCRAAESLIEDSELCAIYELSPKDLKNIAENAAVIKALRDERAHRVRRGIAARESAAKIFVRAPAVLGTILDDKSANPRHRIDSAQALRQTAHGGDDAETARDTERFVIRIDLSAAPDGGEVIEINKDIATNRPKQIEHNDSEIVAASEQNQ